MSFGTKDPFKTKKQLKEAVLEFGAEKIMVTDTSAFDNRGTVSVADLADTSAVIVGPDVYNNRAWYANVRRNKKTGVISIV